MKFKPHPKALTALRYFYEEMPELHVIGAGSLLDFAINEVGIPVGRVESLYLYPLSFIEFLAALDETLIIEAILLHELEQEMSPVVHAKILSLVAQYLALGGMPEVVSCWIRLKDPFRCSKIHETLARAYQQDFGRYAKRSQIKYLNLVFNEIPRQLGRKFKYSNIEGDFRKRELAPALDLLETAGIAHKVCYSASLGFPISAQEDPKDYKVLFVDVGLSQAVLNLELASWFLSPLTEFVNKGPLVEAFVGQEMLAYSTPHIKSELNCWHRETRTSEAEVDYVIKQKEYIIPIEVKAAAGTTLKSLYYFLENHKNSPYGIRFSAHNYSKHLKIHSYPLYAIAQVISHGHQEVKASIHSLIS